MSAARLRSKERETTAESSFITNPQQQQQQTSRFIYIDYELDTSRHDTLHTISMKFGVSITDLKRLNNLQNDRDIYALKFIKIPIKPNSYQSELYASQLKYSDTVLTRLANGDFEPIDLVADQDSEEEHQHKLTATTSSSNQQNLIDLNENNSSESAEETSKLLGNTEKNSEGGGGGGGGGVGGNEQVKEARRFFRKFDNKLDVLISQNQEIINEVKSKHGEGDGNERLVPISNISYMVETRGRGDNNTNYSSSLFSINTRELLAIAICVVVVFPLIIFFYRYLYISEHDPAHKTSHSN